MISIRKSNDRGAANIGWLDSRHTFSFADYHDADHMGFGSLRVINEDWIEPGQGFGTHGHQDMEIITYVISGALEHKDSMQNGSVMRYGDVQRMTAGTGIQHSEFNHSDAEQVHLLQIWILPEESALEPGYEQTSFSIDEKTDQLRLIGSQDGRNGSIRIHQDLNLFATLLSENTEVRHDFAQGRKGWIQVVSGELDVNGDILIAGDGASLQDVADVTLKARKSAEFLLFDMA